MKRRDALRFATATAWAATRVGGAVSAAALAVPARAASAVPRVLVVGGGYGGATSARYLRRFSAGRIEVVLVEPEPAFVSCPLSNLVLTGRLTLAELTVGYDRLAAQGVRVVRDWVQAIDPATRLATLAAGAPIHYDKLVLAPGVELMSDAIAGYAEASRQGRVLSAWTAGPETLALRRRLEAMPEGGVFAIAIPEAPYRCPPAPYERASLVAAWAKRFKPRAKVLVLDANDDVTSKGPLFKRVWAESYAGLLEYRPQTKTIGVDPATGTLRFELADDLRADVVNLIPPMRAGRIAVATGLANANGRWCEVRWPSFESTQAPHIHVIGDAIQTGTLMPKSGSMANSQAKVAAAAIVAELNGWAPDPAPVLANTCYSFVDEARAVHIASVHAYREATHSFEPVAGAGGLSAEPNRPEAALAFGWAKAIWADALG